MSGHFAYREGDYKLILAYGSGGWTYPNENKAIEAGAPKAQIYNLRKDVGEQKNLYVEQSELAERLLTQLKEYINAGASVIGKESKNDAQIVLWKSESKGEEYQKTKELEVTK